MLSLGYPELAAGDFERTLILIDHGLDYSSKYGKSVRLPWLQNWIRIYRGVSPFPRIPGEIVLTERSQLGN